MYLFYQNLQFTYPQAFKKDVQVTGEAFSLQKSPFSTTKDEIYKLFYIFRVIFALLYVYVLRIRIRIQLQTYI